MLICFIIVEVFCFLLDFFCGSAGKEPACNARDLGLIPGLGRSLEKGKATHSSILAWRIPWMSMWGHKESDKPFLCYLVGFLKVDSEIVLCAQFSRYTWMNTCERKAKVARLSRGRNPGRMQA